MNIGMLWFDNSTDNLEIKILTAVRYYQAKYNKQVNLVWVHPTMITGDNTMLCGVVIKKNRSVMPNHFLIGENANQSLRILG